MRPDPFILSRTGDAPWSVAQSSWAGWIPNVSGHLSFNVIGARSGRHAYNQYSDRDDRRTLLVHATRHAQDFPLPGRLIGTVRRSVTLDYVLVARSSAAHTPYLKGDKLEQNEEPEGALVGVIIVVPVNKGTVAASAAVEFLDFVDAVIANGAGVGGVSRQVDELPDYLLNAFDLARPNFAAQLMHFAMFRTGETRIWFDNDEFIGRLGASSPFNSAEQDAANSLPSQAYYFLKDTVHKHYHHDGKADQLLPLVKLDLAADDKEEDARWRMATLRGLARVVIEYRQSATITSNKQALGVLAYADAFQALLARILRVPDLAVKMEPNDKVILYDFAHVRSSLEALDAITESKRGLQLQLIGVLVGVFLSAAALWAGMVQILGPLCEPLKGTAAACPSVDTARSAWFVNLIVANPLAFIVFTLLLGILAFVKFFNGLSAIPLAVRIQRGVRRASFALAATVARKKMNDELGWYTVLFLLGASIVGLLAGAWFITPRQSIPEPQKRQAAPSGPFSMLDKVVGKSISSSSLLMEGRLAAALRDLLGPDYPEFLRLMARTRPLAGNKDSYWAAGGPVQPSGRDGAYLIVGKADGRIEAGFRLDERWIVHRPPGAQLVRPADLVSLFGVGGDVGPILDPRPDCRSSGGGGQDGRTIQYSGAMSPQQPCVYSVALKSGQIVLPSVGASKGLKVVLTGPNGKENRLVEPFQALADGTAQISVGWERQGLSATADRSLRPFYARIRVR